MDQPSSASTPYDTALASLLIGLALLVVAACGELATHGPDGMFRGGPAHVGVYPGSHASEHGQVAWAFQTGGPVRGSPLVDGDLVLVGSGDGRFYAIDRESGEERWRYEAGAAVHSSAAVHGGLVYFGDRSNAFYALDRRTRRERWRVETGADHPWDWGHEGWDYFTSSPVVAGDLIVVGSGDGNVYAFDAATGTERWRAPTGGRVRSSPAIADGLAYIGSADGVLYAVDLETGSVRWRFETEGASLNSAEFGFDRRTIQSSPAVAGGRVFLGSRDGKFYAVQALSGELAWRFDHSTPWVISSPAIYQGAAIVGTSDGLFLHAMDMETGEEVWRFETGDRVFSSPAVSGGVVYVGVHSGRFLALDAARGVLRWELRFGGAVMSSPVVHESRAYFGCDDGSVYAVRLEDGPAPRRAVYWDAERTGWNTFAAHEGVRDYFETRGYELLDRFQLARFMEASNGESGRSVVVFAMDDLPATVAAVPSDTVLARRYLDSGGKIVWLGLPPLILERDADGGITAFSRDGPRALLGVDHDRYDVDQYAAYPAPEGERWGFIDWWVSVSGVDVAEVTTPLALDENGGAAAWVKSYGGPPGTGFVSLWGTYRPIPARYYDQIRRVAEYGIGIAAGER
ncbi:MAG: PQQ-binding-like beta-propeller repeat protein [Gemmatimonadota bacterium]|nr:MAG: PQQ-binding-like beta-propeller repeat protein [Gemmatimonadota bacterium]